MSESTLQITWTELESEIGRYLGLDRTVTNWTANEVLDVAAIAKRGLRQFYFPPRTNEGEAAHAWSFLRPAADFTIWDDLVAADAITATGTFATPVTTITASEAAFYPSMEEKSISFVTSGNTYVIDSYTSSTVCTVTGDASAETGVITIDSGDTFTLPWDFGGMAGDGAFTYANAENTLTDIHMTSDVRIRQLRQSDTSTGTPWLVAIRPMTTDGTQGQRWEAIFHQPPNEEFVLRYRYYVQPDALVDATTEYPYGSVSHSETILESCLAIAETREKDSSSQEHQARYAVLLQASIDRDRGPAETVQHYGYNADGSDGYGYYSSRHREDCWRHNDLVTFNGNDGS